MRTLLLAGLVVVCLASVTLARQTTHTYTVSWTQDASSGVPDGYAFTVDGVRTVVSPAPVCTAAPVMACTAPLTMTTNIAHVVIVSAFNAFGEAASAPFSASPPNRPGVVVIVR